MICVAADLMTITSFAASSNKNSVRVVTTQDYEHAQEVLKQINKEREKRGLNKLKFDKDLTKAAIQRSAEIGVYIPSTSPHRRPNGKLVRSLNKRISYECCYESIFNGENGLGEKMNGYQVVRSWMASSSHKKGILLKGAKSVGIAYVTTNGEDLNCVIEISKTKAKKKVKQKSGNVTALKVVSAKAKYLKKGCFGLFCGNIYNELAIGETSQAAVYICCKHMADFNSTALAVSDFSFSSNNPSVISASSTGLLTGISPGTAVITAKKKNNPKIKVSILMAVI